MTLQVPLLRLFVFPARWYHRVATEPEIDSKTLDSVCCGVGAYMFPNDLQEARRLQQSLVTHASSVPTHGEPETDAVSCRDIGSGARLFQCTKYLDGAQGAAGGRIPSCPTEGPWMVQRTEALQGLIKTRKRNPFYSDFFGGLFLRFEVS